MFIMATNPRPAVPSVAQNGCTRAGFCFRNGFTPSPVVQLHIENSEAGIRRGNEMERRVRSYEELRRTPCSSSSPVPLPAALSVSSSVAKRAAAMNKRKRD